MEQRPLRLGDLIDDYCPRERRVTDHAIVALVGDSIRQTRCTACQSEHEYKEGRMPRKKTGNGHAHDAAGGVLVVPRPAASAAVADESAETGSQMAAAAASAEPADDQHPAHAPAAPQPDAEKLPDGWLAHRPLIRATLPRTESDAPAPRPIPEFTMHQRQGRGFGGRGFSRGLSPYSNGRPTPPFRDGEEPDGNRATPPPGQGHGQGQGQGHGHGHGKSRHRRRHRRPR